VGVAVEREDATGLECEAGQFEVNVLPVPTAVEFDCHTASGGFGKHSRPVGADARAGVEHSPARMAKDSYAAPLYCLQHARRLIVATT
jgi:hypothetical protein